MVLCVFLEALHSGKDHPCIKHLLIDDILEGAACFGQINQAGQIQVLEEAEYVEEDFKWEIAEVH